MGRNRWRIHYLSPGIRSQCRAGRPRRKALTLQTVPVRTKPRKIGDLVTSWLFVTCRSLPANSSGRAGQRKKLERFVPL